MSWWPLSQDVQDTASFLANLVVVGGPVVTGIVFGIRWLLKRRKISRQKMMDKIVDETKKRLQAEQQGSSVEQEKSAEIEQLRAEKNVLQDALKAQAEAEERRPPAPGSSAKVIKVMNTMFKPKDDDDVEVNVGIR